MREGLIPVIVGTAVTTAGMTLKYAYVNKSDKSPKLFPMVAAGVIGFGLAHIFLGSLDLMDMDSDE